MGPQDIGCDRERRKFHEGLTAALAKFAEAHFALSRPDPKTGKTRLRILHEIREQTGVVAPELKALPRLPFGSEHIWQWYNDLDGRRTSGFSINPLTWSDIHSYFTMLRVRPQSWEVRALVTIDDHFIASRINPVAGTVKGAKALRRGIKGE